MLYNINNYVKVKLTNNGRLILKEQNINPSEEDGWTKFQLWDLMSIFGPYLCNGCDLFFETNIELLNV